MIYKNKKLHIEKFNYLEDDGTIRPKRINELFDDVRKIIFKLFKIPIF